MHHPGPQYEAFTVLLVCTGNICRSALAECVGRAYLDEALGDRAHQVRLESAGTRAVVDSAMHPYSELVLAGLGGVAGSFRARQLDERMPDGADLVLTMTRTHRRDVLHGAPRALARTFTLREAADLLRLVAVNATLEGDDLPSLARSLVRSLASMRSRRQSNDSDDIADPIGQPVEVHEEVGTAIAEALTSVLARIAALDASRGGPAG